MKREEVRGLTGKLEHVLPPEGFGRNNLAHVCVESRSSKSHWLAALSLNWRASLLRRQTECCFRISGALSAFSKQVTWATQPKLTPNLCLLALLGGPGLT